MKPIRIYRSRPASLRNGNFGDELTSLLCDRLFDRATVAVPLAQAELLGVGSILDAWYRYRLGLTWRQRVKGLIRNGVTRPARDLHVWGTGAMLTDSTLEWPQRLHFHAVRGELTAGRLGQLAPQVLGDPGILVAAAVTQPKTPTKRVALVPHFVDEKWVAELPLPAHWQVVHTDRDAVDTITSIASSELVISSSLHGLITADAYGIPCIWARSHNDLYKRSDFKFDDHATARRQPFNEPQGYAALSSLSEAALQDLATTPQRNLSAWQSELAESFPKDAFG